MNSGSLHGDTAPARLYRFLRENTGELYDALFLERELHFRNCATIKSAVNDQLKKTGRYGVEHIRKTWRKEDNTVAAGGRIYRYGHAYAMLCCAHPDDRLPPGVKERRSRPARSAETAKW